MALDSLVRSGIALAKSITASLQAEVEHTPWVGNDDYGTNSGAGTPTMRPALVEMRQRLRRDATGKEVMQRATVTFLGPVPPNGATGRREPIDPRDRIVLPDGTTGPILDVSGLADPSTSGHYMLTVALG
jgi:hypothetical protein